MPRADKIFALLPNYVANENNQQFKNPGNESGNESRMKISELVSTQSPLIENDSAFHSAAQADILKPEEEAHCDMQNLVENTTTSPDRNESFQSIMAKRVAGVKRKLVLTRHISAEESQEDFDSDDSVADPNFEEESDEEQSNEETNNDQRNQTNSDQKNTRKKKINRKEWKRNVLKTKRHSGLEYLTENNKIVTQKTLKPACPNTCKLRCTDNITDAIRQEIHKQFWTDQKSIDMKRQYIASHVQQIDIKRRRNRTNQRAGKRQYTNKYTFEVHGKQLTVCKKFFLNTLSVSQQSVDTAIAKKREGGIISPDKRGRYVPSNKTAPEVRENVRNHIMLFPVYESHYSRERSRKKYLGNDLNISRMYQLYIEYCRENNVPEENIAKEWIYSDVFNYEFNYSFKHPDNDTCDDCDMFQLKLRETETTNARLSLQEEYDAHLKDAGDRYKLKATDKEHSRQFQSKKVIMIDLQKCLPTPELHNSQSFYSLKLWTYNLVIHDATAEKAYCMMWDESIAGRGGNEIASCILKWSEISDIPPNVEDLVIWSDNCPSQNRNFQLIMCYLYLLKIKPNLKTISHKFLTKGHTHLEADADHSLIERERKKIPQLKIVTPWDWQQVVRLCGRKKPFDVTGMETKDFLNFKSLCEGNTSPFVVRKKNDAGENFLLSKVVYFQVRHDNPGVLFYKTKFSDEFSSYTLKRNTRQTQNLPEALPPIRAGLRNIARKKYGHLQKLLKWVPQQFQDYYKNLPHGEEEVDE